MPDAWRRWEQAGEALNEAEEAEDFQSVGMRCRECLIVMVRTLSTPDTLRSARASPPHVSGPSACSVEHRARNDSNSARAGTNGGTTRCAD
jgi:hypothetical protein